MEMKKAMALTVAVALAGCSSDDWKAVSYARGDTTVVRTESGSGWGGPATLVEEMRVQSDPATPAYAFRSVRALTVDSEGDLYVLDGPSRGLVVYDPAGQYVNSIEGFFLEPDGLEVLPDGRLVVRDGASQLLRVFSRRGNLLEDWPLPQASGVRAMTPLFADPENRLYTQIVVDSEEQQARQRRAYLRYSSDGAIQDTIPDPEIDFRPLTLAVDEPDGGRLWFLIPFSPRALWTRSRLGDVVIGISAEYALVVLRPDGKLVRIEREVQAVPTEEDERWSHYHRVDRRARQIDYKWTWGGPVIPETKPFFKRLFTDRDGRIWVQLHQPAERMVPEEPAGEEVRSEMRIPLQRSRERWVEPIVFDVFEPDGRYLGQVRAPTGFRVAPRPVIEGDHVWAVVREADEPLSIVRFRIER